MSGRASTPNEIEMENTATRKASPPDPGPASLYVCLVFEHRRRNISNVETAVGSALPPKQTPATRADERDLSLVGR